jgi:Protein of unknown function (DUF3551)
MRIQLCTIIAALAISATVPARAQTYDPRYPICMQIVESLGGMHIDCSFTSMRQCQASASGRPATCSINPYFVPVYPEPSGRVYPRRHRIY